MDARLFRLGDHSGAKNLTKGIVGKPLRTADSSKTVSKRTGHVGVNKHSKFVNTMDNTQESTLHGHSNDSGENHSDSDSEHFSNNLEHQNLLSTIVYQQIAVKN